jgi:hypothetical protein
MMAPIPAHTYTSPWESFYVIVGSSAAALTGLQFVVMALVAESDHRSSMREVNAFGTPNVVHFCAALLISGILSAPWHRLTSAAIGLVATGIAGVIYVVLVTRRAKSQTGYQPVLQDWIWHAALPFVAYAALLVSAILLRRHPEESLFVIGTVAILMVFIGIHNAWDTVTFIAVERRDNERTRENRSSSSER